MIELQEMVVPNSARNKRLFTQRNLSTSRYLATLLSVALALAPTAAFASTDASVASPGGDAVDAASVNGSGSGTTATNAVTVNNTGTASTTNPNSTSAQIDPTPPTSDSSPSQTTEISEALKAVRRQIFEYDRSILLECADLARFRLRFHAQANRSGFWRSWIYPIEQETGTGLSFCNTLTDLSQRARGLNDPDKISRTSVKNGLACAVTGQTITATSSSIELLHNGYVAWSAAQSGFSPKKSEAIVRLSIEKIDRMLAQRERLLASNPAIPRLRSLELQGRLLQHIRNQLLYSFKRFSVQSREQAWSENTFYAIDVAQALLQMSASCMSFQGFTARKYIGLAAITNVVANSLVTINPPFRTAVGRFIAAKQRRHLEKAFPQEKPHTMPQLKKQWEDLADIFPEDAKVAFDTTDVTIKEVAFLCMQSELVDQSLNRNAAEINRLHRVADQQAVAGPIIGLFSLARSTGATVAYYGCPNDRIKANRINFGGRISQTFGQTYSLIATPKAKIKSILYQRKLRKHGELPSQIYERGMNRWNAIEAGVKAAKLN